MGTLKLKTSHKNGKDKVMKEPSEEDRKLYKEIQKAPGFTGDHAKDKKNKHIQAIVQKRRIRQKV